MRPPVIPDTLAICATCNNAFAMQGKQECCECLLEARFAAWALADGDPLQFPKFNFAELRRGDPPFATPRITEVPNVGLVADMERRAKAEARARRVAVWIGLIALWAFAAGWCFGRLG